MERPDLIPHLTPKEQVSEKLDKHVAELRARIAKIQERLGKEAATKAEEPQIQPPESSTPPIVMDEKRKAAGEAAEKEYVMKDGQLTLKEYAE